MLDAVGGTPLVRLDRLLPAAGFLLAAVSTCGTVRGCGEYARDHGLGTRIIAVDAVKRYADRIPAGAVCVLMLCERGGRYLDTVYSDDWGREHSDRVDKFEWRGHAERTPRPSHYQ